RHGHTTDVASDGDIRRRLEGSVAISQEDAYFTIATSIVETTHNDVGIAVTIQVCHNHGGGSCLIGTYVSHILKGSVAVSQQHPPLVPPGHDEIRLVVTIQVGNGQKRAVTSQC